MADEYQDDFEEEVKQIAADVVSSILDLTATRVKNRRQKRYQQEGEFVDYLKERENETFKKQILVVVATPKSLNEYKETEEYAALSKIIYDNTFTKDGEIHYGVELEVISENKEGLPKIYNKFIHVDYEDYYVCFIHDDVVIYDNHFSDKLIKSHENNEVVGLAGATRVNLPFTIDKPTAWHRLSLQEHGNKQIKHQSGFVAHEKDGQTWSTMFGLVPQQIKLMDGLFMSFDVSKCIDSGFTFDEDFKFHHYDLTASIRAIQCGLKIVTTDVMVKHKGIGVMDQSWVESHKKFVTKYKDFNG